MSIMKQQQRVVLVTGANKGIGFNVVKKLIDDPSRKDTIVLLGTRDLSRGQEALEKLGNPSNVHLLQLDMSSIESINQAVEQIKDKYPNQLDIVINNAGINIEELTVEAARLTFSVNYYGIKQFNQLLYPLINENARIINVSSQLGPMVLEQTRKELQEKYISSSLTIEQLDQLVEEFISAIETNTLADIGQYSQPSYLIYGFSKVALNSLTQIEAHQWSTTKNLLVVSVSPGYCATDMTQNSSNARSPELGADSILHAVDTPRNHLVNGGFYRDGIQLTLISKST